MAKKEHLHFLPTSVCVLAPVTFVITFVIATSLHHVAVVFPYISDTANESPESCIFSQLLNIVSFLLFICVYIRYLQVDQFATFRTPIGRHLNYNNISWYIGASSCLGMDIVANFQVGNVYQVHYVGAALCFIGGAIYFLIQTIFSYHMSKVEDSKWVFYLRGILCVVSFGLCITCVTSGVISEAEFEGTDFNNWLPGDGGYDWHIVSTVTEWLLALTQSSLVLTFLPEFRRMVLYTPKMEIEGITQ